MGAYKRLGKLRSGSELQSWIRARPRPLHGRKCASTIWRSCPIPKCRRERPARARFDTVTDHAGTDALASQAEQSSQNFRRNGLALRFDAEVDYALAEIIQAPQLEFWDVLRRYFFPENRIPAVLAIRAGSSFRHYLR